MKNHATNSNLITSNKNKPYKQNFMKTKRISLISSIIVLVCLLSTPALLLHAQISASNKYITKNMPTKNFDKIKLLGSLTVEYTQTRFEQLTFCLLPFQSYPASFHSPNLSRLAISVPHGKIQPFFRLFYYHIDVLFSN